MRPINTIAALLLSFLGLAHSAVSFSDHYVFVGAYFPSILEQSANGDVTGLGADIARQVVHELGDSLEIQVMPWKRAQELVKSGKAHVLIGPYKTQARQAYLTFSHYGFYQDSMVIYTRKDSQFQWQGQLSALKDIPIGVTRGWSYGDNFDRYRKQLNLQVANDVKTNFEKLLHNRVDLIISHQRNSLSVINALNIHDSIKIVLPPVDVNTGYFGFSKHHELSDFIHRFNQQYERLLQTGKITQLNKKYALYFDVLSNDFNATAN